MYRHIAVMLAVVGLATGCSSTPAPTPTPTAPPPPPPTPIVAATLAPIATLPPPAVVVPTPAPASGVLIVANTGGEGVTLRRTPGSGERIRVWPDGAEMQIIGDTQQADGRTWARVRDPEGNEGWIAAEFLVDRATYAALPTPVVETPPTVNATPAGPTPTFPALRPTFTPAPATGPTPPVAQPKPVAPTFTPSGGGAVAKPTSPPAPGPGSGSGSAGGAPTAGPAPGGSAPPAAGGCPGNAPIKASGGVYYMPGSPGYADAGAGACFATEQAAQGAGYSRAR